MSYFTPSTAKVNPANTGRGDVRAKHEGQPVIMAGGSMR